MPKIDVSTIQGFDGMTPEEKLQALLSFEYDDGAETAKTLKAAVDKAASEAAAYKKQLNATKSEEELKRQESEETLKAMQEKLAEYEQRERIAAAKAMFLGGGFDEATAAAAADAFVSGDNAKMASALKKYNAAIMAQAKSSLMDSNPNPDSANQADNGGNPANGAKPNGEAADAAKIFAELHDAQFGAQPATN